MTTINELIRKPNALVRMMSSERMLNMTEQRFKYVKMFYNTKMTMNPPKGLHLISNLNPYSNEENIKFSIGDGWCWDSITVEEVVV